VPSDNVHRFPRLTNGVRMDLRGAVVVVTGASAGIGEATALAFAAAGSSVVLAARRLDRLEGLAERIARAGGTASAVACDVGDPGQLAGLRDTVDEGFGGADVLVSNAGVPGGRFEDLSSDEIERVVRVNLLGVIHGAHAFLPGMRARGRGHIVNVASLAGRFASPAAEVYTATKHAVVGFSGSLHLSTWRDGVAVTAVNPGFVRTEGFRAEGVPGWFVLDVERVAAEIVHVVHDGIAPERSVPRWVAPLEAFRVLTPPLYRWGMRTITGVARRRTPR
jgi:short-subunit dehydrogenase